MNEFGLFVFKVCFFKYYNKQGFLVVSKKYFSWVVVFESFYNEQEEERKQFGNGKNLGNFRELK